MPDDDAYQYLLRLLSKREYSRHQLEQKAQARYPSEEITPALDRLTEQRFLSDERFAAAYTRHLRDIQHYGPVLIRQRLAQAGLDSATIHTALEEEYPPETLHEQLCLWAEKRHMTTPASQKDLQFLLRKGFLWDDIRRAGLL